MFFRLSNNNKSLWNVATFYQFWKCWKLDQNLKKKLETSKTIKHWEKHTFKDTSKNKKKLAKTLRKNNLDHNASYKLFTRPKHKIKLVTCNLTFTLTKNLTYTLT